MIEYCIIKFFRIEFGIPLKKILLLWFKMQKSSHITRLFSVFLMSLIMMFTIFGKTFSATQLRQQEVKKTKTEQSNHSHKSDNASISELSVMQVSASMTIDFSQAFFFTPQVYSFLIFEKRFSVIKNLSFRLPLLEILFEHFIVTNAP